MQKKILVAVDGSPYSNNALKYIGKLFQNLTDIHFHLFSIVPTSGPGPAAREWLTEDELFNIISPGCRNKLIAQKKYMQEAIRQLTGFGISEDQISQTVQLSKFGVAEDIIQQTRIGNYDALLIGRRGIGKLEELFMGSVSATILDKCHDFPIWVIDGEVNPAKFLVPFDGTCHAMMAIDHLSFILADNPYAEVTLFYSTALLGDQPKIIVQDFYDIWGKEWCDQHLSRPDSLFHGPKQLLIDNGFPADKIFWLQTFKGIDPSRQILRQSLLDEFGTIVLGRRGEDVDKGIFRGVSDRVLLMAEQVAVWIVG
ncbi:MAG: universal stress protein [Desulfobulbaceae bacterium]|nr:universal stress protein [Desulfobulbaceae bacterium]HIJ79543.1 universal stress protein [Deltaproteobacteria bacterium]